MKKFVPYEKLSKSKKRELDRKKRVTWRNVKPVTRKVESKNTTKESPETLLINQTVSGLLLFIAD